MASTMAPKRRYYQFTAIDDCTRLRVLRLYERCNQKTAIQFVDYVAERLFPIEVIQTDNGSEFGPTFHWHVLDKGISHVYIKPATPRLNGKVERSHRSSTAGSRASSSTTRKSSTTSSGSGRTITTIIVPTADWVDRPPYERLKLKRQPRPPVHGDRQLHGVEVVPPDTNRRSSFAGQPFRLGRRKPAGASSAMRL